MATREENIKKINERLEKLTDEELDNVVGGTWSENEEILLTIAKVDPEAFKNLLMNWDQDQRKLGAHLEYIVQQKCKNLGVDVEFTPWYIENEYKIDGKSVTHKQFIDFLNTIGSWEIV